MTLLCYRRHCFPAEIIQRAIWLYLRSPARSGHAKAALGWPCRNPRRPSMGFAPENQVRTGRPAGGRWIRTIGPRHERGGFCCGRRIAGPNGGSQKGLFLMRYRWFESISLQRRVRSEPGHTLGEQRLYDYGLYNLRQRLAPIHGVTFPTPAGGTIDRPSLNGIEQPT